jgi:predicted MFS family arabinose efflux permease
MVRTARVVPVLTCVLALATADQGALSATAATIQDYYGISKAEFGLLGTVSTAVTAAATLPFGVLVDRTTRTRLLGWVILLWAAAMVASGLAPSYLVLVGTRVFLGMVAGVAYPATASLIGDYFPSSERARVYGYVLSGELLGTGVGILVATFAASVFDTWRAAMFVLVPLAIAVSWLVFRLPEPARGSSDRMPGLGSAIRHVLRVRTNIILIVASALGYFFFAGLRFFGIQWVELHYGLGRGVASSLVLVFSAFAVGGVLVGGRVADRLLARGMTSARVVVPAVTIVGAAVLFAPGIITSSVALALALTLPGAFLFAASNPPLDAARLDVMPSALWGRAEAVRTLCRGGIEAAGPVSFGWVAGAAFGSREDGLTYTFVVMLVPLLLSGALLAVARRTYPSDVAAARETSAAAR